MCISSYHRHACISRHPPRWWKREATTWFLLRTIIRADNAAISSDRASFVSFQPVLHLLSHCFDLRRISGEGGGINSAEFGQQANDATRNETINVANVAAVRAVRRNYCRIGFHCWIGKQARQWWTSNNDIEAIYRACYRNISLTSKAV